MTHTTHHDIRSKHAHTVTLQLHPRRKREPVPQITLFFFLRIWSVTTSSRSFNPHTHSLPPPPHKPLAPSRLANSSLFFYPISPLHSPCRFPRAPPSSSSRATSSRTSARSSAALPTAPPCGQTSPPKRGDSSTSR